MEQAVLEERDYLNQEMRRLVKSGADAQKISTVQQMLNIVERRAKDLRLKSKEESSSSTKLGQTAGSQTVHAIITDLNSNQPSCQRNSLVLLSDALHDCRETNRLRHNPICQTWTDQSLPASFLDPLVESKKSFVIQGGADALISLLSSSNDGYVLKALEQLQDLSFRGLILSFLVLSWWSFSYLNGRGNESVHQQPQLAFRRGSTSPAWEWRC